MSALGHGVLLEELSAAERDEVLLLLSLLDGGTTWSAVRDRGWGLVDPDEIASSLLDARVLCDARSAWQWFQQVASNPPLVPMPMDAAAAYATPAWDPAPGEAERPCAPPDRAHGVAALAGRRRSPDLPGAPVEDPAGLSEQALELVVSTMLPDAEGRMAFGSGGGMWPTQAWVLAREGSEPRRRILVVDHRRARVVDYNDVPESDVVAVFAGDPRIEEAVRNGAGVVVITADPRRTGGKYGNRGWHLILMEAGAVGHHLALLAVEAGLQVRQIAGFREDAVGTLLPLNGLVPVLAAVVLPDARVPARNEDA